MEHESWIHDAASLVHLLVMRSRIILPRPSLKHLPYGQASREIIQIAIIVCESIELNVNELVGAHSNYVTLSGSFNTSRWADVSELVDFF